MTKKTIATQILERKFQKRSGIPAQPGLNAASSPPPASTTPPSGPAAFGRALSSSAMPSLPKPIADGLNTAGNAIWNNGGRQITQNVIAPAAQVGMNSLHGISTAGVGLANAGAGGVGNVVSALGYGAGAATDAAGLTNNAKSWVANNMWRHTNNAARAGLEDFAGGVADTLTGGKYDYDGTFAGPAHSGTAVEQMRSGIRDQLGRGSGFDTAFNTANAVGDFAANQAAFGGTGRAINVGAQALRGSRLAAPALNAAAQTPVVGAPAASAGRWLAGEAPAANMFQKGLVPYYRASGLQSVADDVYNAGNQIAQVTNPTDRPADAREYQAQLANASAEASGNETPPQETPYVDSVTYADPADRADLYARALSQETPQAPEQTPVQPDGTQAAQAQAQQPAGISPQAFGGAPPQGPTAATAPAAKPTGQAPPANTQDGRPKDVRDARPSGLPVAPQVEQSEKQKQTQFADLHTQTQQVLADKTATPEAQRASLEKLMSAHAEQNQKLTAGYKDKLAGLQTDASAAFDKSFEAAASNEIDTAYREWKAQNPNSSPQEDGQFLGQMTQQFSNMPPEAQWMLGAGVPMALIGMGMSLFGGGGLGSLLMTVLGLGAAGLGATSAGLFGQGAQDSLNHTIGGLGKSLAPMLGINLPNEQDIRGRLETAAKQGPDAAQSELEKVRGELQPYAKFSPEAQKFLTESSDKNYMYNQARDYVSNNFDQLLDQHLADPKSRNWSDWAAKTLGMGSNAAKQDGSWAQDGVLGFSGYGAPGSPERTKFIEETMLPRSGWVKTQSVNIMRKAARCWAGYEPVPGKKPYSNDSCRPIGGKKKKKKTEKKAVEGYTGAHSNRPFDVEHAAKMFKMPAKNPQLVYNRMMNTWKQNKFSPAQFSEMRQKYDGLPPAFNPTAQPPVPPQPAPTAPQQAVKPAAPTASPSATPVAPPSPATAPKPAPQNRPIMTQMTTQTGQPQPSPGATAYIKSTTGGRR